ncbi:hypothetical protein ACFW3Z_08805 [Nocardiopsis alba]|uniref:hypothetical protein n=1 Tax=Nocardiopsis alba TaxID=53437 RepID=UPI0033E2003C
MVSVNASVRWAAVGLSAVFVLTACSSSESEVSEGAGSVEDPAGSTEEVDSPDVFDFTELSMGPVQTIEFRVPDELIEMDQEYAENRVVDSITVSATEAEDPSQCAVRYEFGYTGDDLDRLTEFAENHYETRPPREAAFNAFTGEAPNDTDMEDDFSSAVVQLKCALSPSDDSDTAEARFVRTNDKGGTTHFILAEFSVMSDGELFVHRIEARSWRLDSNGNWVKG